MKQDRRTFIASAGTIAATAIAGCSQISSDRPLEFESAPARVPEDTLGETGYEETDTEAIEVERTFDIGGEERAVTVTNQRVAYEKEIRAEIELPEALPGVVFTTLTTPSVEILGQEANPVESDGDFIVGAGAHPQLLADEDSTVVSMIEAIRHEG